eukprot:10576500-Lingulodinium_polyedra.AAC.1
MFVEFARGRYSDNLPKAKYTRAARQLVDRAVSTIPSVILTNLASRRHLLPPSKVRVEFNSQRVLSSTMQV